MNDATTGRQFPRHEVSAATLPDDSTRVCPLIGNDEIKLVLDARGVMHDFEALPSYPPPRIVWAGRRHNLRQDRYSSNLFEWGFIDMRIEGEEDLPPVTGWHQRLHPRQGYVETHIQRGTIEERTLTFVHLEHNLVVVHREYRNLPRERQWTVDATYTFCHVGAEEIPFRATWTPCQPWEDGIAADTTADGLKVYRGRIALLADTPCTAEAAGNQLHLRIPVTEGQPVTVYLSLADDLGNEPQLLTIPDGGWMSDAVREVNRENLSDMEAWKKPDPVQATEALRQWVKEAEFDGVFSTHQQAWQRFWDQCQIQLPSHEETLTAALETQLYTIRCSCTPYSLPANPFNSSWGAGYFWDERFPVEGLMALGCMEMPQRVIEWRRRILPFCTMMTAGRGARYTSCAVEPGNMIADRNGTQFYEFFQMGVFVNYIRQYCRYLDDEAVWRRYYPIIRESAEFYRNWLLVELPGNHLMVVPLIDVNESIYPVQDGPFTICGAARILHLAHTLADKLGVDEGIAREWKRLGEMALLQARHQDKDGACYTDMELGDLPEPELAQDPAVREWRDEYKRTHGPEDQFATRQENVSGEKELLPFWSWGTLQQAYRAATLGKPDEAMEQLRRSLTTMMDFAALNESAKTDLSVVHHPWFTTGAGAYVRALTRMLLYPKDDDIFLLAGITNDWTEFAFTLPAHNNTLVSVEVRDGQLRSLRISTDRAGEQCRRLHIPLRFLSSPSILTDQTSVVAQAADSVTVDIVFHHCADLIRDASLVAEG